MPTCPSILNTYVLNVIIVQYYTYRMCLQCFCILDEQNMLGFLVATIKLFSES